MKLADFVEQISDDFQSTFSVVDEDTLMNLFFFEEMDRVADIIKKYLPNAQITFTQTGHAKSEDEPDIYLVRAKV